MSVGPDAELSFDGLNRVNHARFAGVWIRDGVDFSAYGKLLVLPAEIAYKKDPAKGGRDAGYELDERQMEKLRELFRDVFRAEVVDKGGWEVVQEPGPDVLLAQPGLIDLVVSVPTKSNAGRGGNWVSSYGSMTLVVQLYDSQTRRILARVIDRQEVVPSAGAEFSKAEMSASIELRVFFQKWAERLREGMDAVRKRQP